MKCAYHPDIDAAGVCVRCGRMLCKDCAMVLANKVYCQPCADQVFTGRSPTGPAKNHSGLLTAGGVLGIIGGVFGLLNVLVIVFYGVMMASLFSADEEFEDSSDGIWIMLVIFGAMGIVLTALSVMAIVGGISALKRRRFGLALGGSICCVIPSSVFGILAIVFIAMSKDEFEKKAPASQEAPR